MTPTPTRSIRTIATWLCMLAAAGTAVAQTPAADRLQQLKQRAAAGDAVAAESAGLMLYHGPDIYGAGIAKDPQAAAAYLEQAGRAGRSGARTLLQRMAEEAEAARRGLPAPASPSGC